MFENTEALVKLKDITTGSSSALNTPVSFVSKVVSENIQNVPLESATSKLLPLATDQISALSNIAKRFDTAIPVSLADSSKLLSTVASSISNNISNAQSVMSSVLQSISGSTLPNILDNTLSYAKKLLPTESILPSGILDNISDIGNLESLTSTLSDTLTNIGIPTVTNIISGDFKDILKDSDIINTAIKTLTSQFEDIGGINISDMVMQLYSYNDYDSSGFQNYPRYTNQDTTRLNSTFGYNNTLTGSNLSNISKMINELCSGYGLDDMYPYRLAKDRYDLLSMLLSLLGLDAGLRGLLNCRMLYDKRSRRILNNYSRPISINRGDPYIYRTVVDTLDPKNISNPHYDLMLLNANMQFDDRMENTVDKYNTYNSLLNTFDTDIPSLVKGKKYHDTYESYDTIKIATMSKSNTQIITDSLGETITKTALGIFSKWL
jgi:hypothetical protein